MDDRKHQMPGYLRAAADWSGDKHGPPCAGDTDNPGAVPQEAPVPGGDEDQPGTIPADVPPGGEPPNEPGEIPPETPPPPD